MYKYVGMGLLGLFIVMMIPSGLANVQDEPKHYGLATLEVHDAIGNIVFEQSLHNLITDEGEHYLALQVFNDGGTDDIDADQIDTICITQKSGFAEVEALVVGTFNTEDATTQTNCISGAATVSTTTASTDGNKATLAFTFDSPTHIVSTQTLTGIGICSDQGETSPFNQCSTTAGAAPLLATINTSDVQLTDPETVVITYEMIFE